MILDIPVRDKVLVVAVSSMTTIVGFATITLRGSVLEDLIKSPTTTAIVVFFATLYVILEIASRSLSLLDEFLANYITGAFFKNVWIKFKPEIIPLSKEGNSESFFTAAADCSIKILDARSIIRRKLAKVIATLIVFVYSTIHYEFYWPLFFAPLIIGGSAFASRKLSAGFEDVVHRYEDGKIVLLEWIGALFKARKDVFHNWRSFDSKSYANWFQSKGENHGNLLKRLVTASMKQEFLTSLLMDWPYIVCCGFVFLFAAKGKISIGQAYVWFGVTGLLIQSGVSIMQIGIMREKIKGFKNIVDTKAAWLLEPLTIKTVPSEKTYREHNFELNDNSVIRLGTMPGLYRIDAKNGSGKSFLIETIIGMNDEYHRWEPFAVEKIRSDVALSSRIIQRESQVFPEWNDFWSQVFGFSKKNPSSRDLEEMLFRIFPGDLSEKWSLRLREVASKWGNRNSKSLSSGEKIALSFGRAISHWDDDVRVVIADECDAFLDTQGKMLFHETLQFLSKKYAVYYVSHNGEI